MKSTFTSRRRKFKSRRRGSFKYFPWLSILNFILPIPIIILVFSLSKPHQYKYRIENQDGDIIHVDSFKLIDSTNIIYMNTNGSQQRFSGKFKIDSLQND